VFVQGLMGVPRETSPKGGGGKSNLVGGGEKNGLWVKTAWLQKGEAYMKGVTRCFSFRKGSS